MADQTSFVRDGFERVSTAFDRAAWALVLSAS